MLYDLSNEYHRKEFSEYARKLLAENAKVELKKKLEVRTSAQNRYLHAILGFFAAEFGMTLDEVKVKIFKELCNADIFKKEITAKNGKKGKVLRSSASISTLEMTTAIERFRNFSAEQGLYIPSPEEKAFLLYAEREIEKAREFINNERQ